MPVYVYHCGNCEFEFEQQQKFTDKPLKPALNAASLCCIKFTHQWV